MKIRVDQKAFSDKLSEANRFTASKSSTPLLSGYFLEASEDNKLSLRTSSGVVVYETRITCEVEEPGHCVVPASLFLSVIKSLETGEVLLTLKDDSLEIKQKRSVSSMSIMSVDGFPELHRERLTKKLMLPVNEFVKIGQKVMVSASTDETKPVLTSLALEMAQPNALVSTDGFRLFRWSVDLALDEKGTFLLPARALKDFFAILEKTEETTLLCWTDPDRQEILFDLGDGGENTVLTSFQVSSIQGEFPPYQAIIPESVGFSLKVDRELFSQRVSQAMIFAREFSSIVVFEVDTAQETPELVVSSQASVKGKTESRLPINSLEGTPVKFACNGRYVLDYLGATAATEVVISGNESLKPVLLSNSDNNQELYLIMPFKLQE
jgi:DNA polymerase-3 subunit beta